MHYIFHAILNLVYTEAKHVPTLYLHNSFRFKAKDLGFEVHLKHFWSWPGRAYIIYSHVMFSCSIKASNLKVNK